MRNKTGRALFRIFVGDEMIAAANTIHDITEAVWFYGPNSYQVEEIIADERVGNRHVSRFWGWVTHGHDGTISIEPCLSILEG
jgi:hypothetical protein